MFNFNWFRKPAAPIGTPVPRNSLFSTEMDIYSPINIDQWMEILKLSFQRTPADFRASGNAAATAAMDANIKALGNQPGSFAMDSPTDGNPLSMKPLIEPINNVPIIQLAWYAAQGFIGWQICAMIAQHWLINKACEMPGQDAIRNGYEITANDGEKLSPEILKKIRLLDKKYKVKKNCEEMIKFGRVFGIRIVMFKIETNDKEFYDKPFNIDSVTKGSYIGMSQIDPYWVSPWLDAEAAADPASIHFYEPTWWVINGRKIHRTHLVIMRNSDVADILKPTYLYGGIPVPQQIAERVFAAERTANEAPMLALTKRLYTQKMDLTAAMANQGQLNEKLQWQNMTRDNFGTLAIGLEDEVNQLDTTLTDLDEVIMTQYQLVAAAARVPATKLLETSPKGFQTTGEYENRSYDQDLESIQTNYMEPLLERHYELLAKSESTPEVEITWNPVNRPTAEQMAALNKAKAETGNILVTAGAIDGKDERNRIIIDRDSGYNGIEAVVAGGPGDRQAEQERRDMEMENAATNASDET